MNTETQLSLDESVAEVLGLLTGLDLTYEPELDRYRAITRQLNRALRANALDNEWSYYHSMQGVGYLAAGDRSLCMSGQTRPRIIGDDAAQLRDDDGRTVRWAYFLPRDAIHKYEDRSPGLWVCSVRNELWFSRPILEEEDGLQLLIPVMREPTMFRLPDTGKTVSKSIRQQLIDFPYPDAVIARAAYFYAQTDPVMQPRAQTLEDSYKDMMFQLIERDTANTDTPYENNFILPLENGLTGRDPAHYHGHPHADEWSRG